MNSEQFQRVANAITLIEGNKDYGLSLNQLADKIGLSPFHMQRLFVEGVGVSPKEFARYLQLQEAKRHLLSHSVLSTAAEMGLSGSSRVHDLLTRIEAISPGEYKSRGSTISIRWTTFETSLGLMVIGKTERGICHLEFLDGNEAPVDSLRASWPLSPLIHAPSELDQDVQSIQARISGQPISVPIGILMKGSPFRVQVWKALLGIPRGQTTTYGALSENVERPLASRAVGSAVGANGLACLIPCHRVILASGKIGEYRWSHARKVALLAQEWAGQRAE